MPQKWRNRAPTPCTVALEALSLLGLRIHAPVRPCASKGTHQILLSHVSLNTAWRIYFHGVLYIFCLRFNVRSEWHYFDILTSKSSPVPVVTWCTFLANSNVLMTLSLIVDSHGQTDGRPANLEEPWSTSGIPGDATQTCKLNGLNVRGLIRTDRLQEFFMFVSWKLNEHEVGHNNRRLESINKAINQLVTRLPK